MSSPTPIIVGNVARPLNGKKALVTGASRGIGAAIAIALAAAGADVVISHSNSADAAAEVVRSIEATGQRGFVFQADQANQSAVKALVEESVKKLGGLDILVNNAGVFAAINPTTDFTEEQVAAVDRMFAVNVTGVATAVRTAAKYLPDGGRIITIGSVSGSSVPMAGLSDYAASKSALQSYHKGWARDFGSKVTVNLVQPGMVDTKMNPGDGPYASFSKATPVGRHGQPEEIAAAVLFLATPAASFVTGSVWNVDGGIAA